MLFFNSGSSDVATTCSCSSLLLSSLNLFYQQMLSFKTALSNLKNFQFSSAEVDTEVIIVAQTVFYWSLLLLLLRQLLFLTGPSLIGF